MAGLMDISFDAFCAKYKKAAMDAANLAFAYVVKKNGSIHIAIDQELVKDTAVFYGLEKVYMCYDDEKAGESGVKAFLKKVVFNQTLTELTKESNRVGAGKGRRELDNLQKAGSRVVSVTTYEHKEDLINDMLEKVKKLKPVDQVIINSWIQDQKNFLELALSELNLPDTPANRNVLSVRFNRAKKLLGQLMQDRRVSYREVYTPLSSVRHANFDADAATPDRNAMRRRARAATAQITGKIDYKALSEKLSETIL